MKIVLVKLNQNVSKMCIILEYIHVHGDHMCNLLVCFCLFVSATPSTSTQQAAAAAAAAAPATPVMYQTPQGVVYATSPGTVNALSEGIFLNYHPSTSNSLSFPSEQGMFRSVRYLLSLSTAYSA